MSSCSIDENEEEDKSLMSHSSDPSLYSAYTPLSPFDYAIVDENNSENLLVLGNSISQDECYKYSEIDDTMAYDDLADILELPAQVSTPKKPIGLTENTTSDDDTSESSNNGQSCQLRSIVLPPGITLVKIPMKPHNSVDISSASIRRSYIQTSPHSINNETKHIPDVIEITKISNEMNNNNSVHLPNKEKNLDYVECMSPKNSINSTTHLIEQAGKMWPNYELKSIEFKVKPSPGSSSRSNVCQRTESDNLSKRAIAFRRLKQALRKQMPFIAGRPTITRNNNVQKLTFDCTLLSPNKTHMEMPVISNIRMHQQCNSNILTMQSTSITMATNQFAQSESITSVCTHVSANNNSTVSSHILSPQWFSENENSIHDIQLNVNQKEPCLMSLNQSSTTARVAPNNEQLSNTTIEDVAHLDNEFDDTRRAIKASRAHLEYGDCEPNVGIPDHAETLDDIVAFINDDNGEFGTPILDRTAVVNPLCVSMQCLSETSHSTKNDEMIIDVESVDDESDQIIPQNYPSSASMLKCQSNDFKQMPQLLTIVPSSYKTVETSASIECNGQMLSPYSYFFQTESSLNTIQFQPRTSVAITVQNRRSRMSSYARQLLRRRTSAIKALRRATYCRNARRSYNNINKFNEIDIMIRIEATDFSLESLDDIPINHFFVPDESFDINDYL